MSVVTGQDITSIGAPIRDRSRRRMPVWIVHCLVLAACLACTVWLYDSSLGYGFLLDDAMDLPRASGRSYLEILTAAGDSAYYRPLVFLSWKALYDLLGRYDPRLLHSISLGLHAFNGLLVYLLGRRLVNPATGIAASLFFLSFHFSYQAVPVINSFFHLMLTFCVLGSLLMYLKAREAAALQNPSLPWIIGALLLALLGCLTHEFGVTVVAAVMAMEMRDRLAGRPARWTWIAGYWAVVAVFAVLWWSAPKWSTGWHGSLSILQVNAGYFAQGLIFPIAPHLQGLAAVLPLGHEGLIGLMAAALVVAGLILARRFGQALTLLAAVAWFLAAVAPAWLLLPYHSYLVDSPRLMYYPAVAAALAWAVGAGCFLRVAGRWRRIAQVGWGLMVLAILFQNAYLVRQSNSLLALSRPLTASLIQAMDSETGGRMLVVNFPAWFAPQDNPYLLGHLGYSSLPDYIGLNRLAYVITGQQRDIQTVAFPPLSAQLPYNYGYHGSQVSLEELSQKIRQAGSLYLAEYNRDGVRLRLVGSQRAAGIDAGEYRAIFGDWARLERVQYSRGAEGLEVELEWRSLNPQPADYTVFLHLYGPDGRPVAQADGYPLAGLLPPRLWEPGTIITDRRLVKLPPNLPAGEYVLATGWYDRSSGSRAPARTSQAEPFQNDVVVLGNVVME